MTEETLKLDPFSMNRGQRRRMKRALKMGRTPSREEAGTLIIAGYGDSPDVKVEPVKVRVPRAFEAEQSAGALEVIANAGRI